MQGGTVVERQIEGISLDETYCHLYAQYGNAPRARCGVPRSEQHPHSVNGSQTALVCATCGLRRCPSCLRRQFDDQ